ncbi:RnfABCDGE type electron transport complex subunit D [Halodesulfovibrio marinisediminis]|uniref:Ion-translocating oxidoreductase complex subunit D n=1 Tax=Halodesulfovibrio marinisediminis DSM 17456 TaxID=1121457 RepID=A0A1N6F4X9_9BACT|nr:RnfABCDGE type electron transport complex subunit D [Halodesulfovibrio marinisediminis]SIN90299.1 electron transport complex protein RnfD [Halodesulfovibrio marinisediminis DSM 17456]
MAKQSLPTAPFLKVASAPHMHCGVSIKGMMSTILVALLPAAAGAIYWYGMEAVRVMALSIATAVIVEALCARIMEKEIRVDDFHAVVTGLLFAFILPAGAEWWLVVAGSAITMILGKMLWGNLGGAPINAIAVGWAFCVVSWPVQMNVDATMLNTILVNPLSQLKYFGIDYIADISMTDHLMGNQLGTLGAVQVGAILLGGIVLLARRIITWEIPVATVASLLVVGGIYYSIDPTLYASPLFHLFTGSTMLAVFFLLPDFTSSPNTRGGKIVFGLMAGFLIILIRTYGQYPDGVLFAVLLANMITPLCDMIKPKPFGAR